MRTVVSLSHRGGQVTLAGGGEALELLEPGVLKTDCGVHPVSNIAE